MIQGEAEEAADDRTFPERVERMNVAFLVQIPTKDVERYMQLVEDALNSVEGKRIFVKVSTHRLFIKEAFPRDRRDDDNVPRPPPRPRFDFGTDRNYG